MPQATYLFHDAKASHQAMIDAEPKMGSLLEVSKQQTVIIDAIVANDRFGLLDETVEQRLQDLGFLPETHVRVVAKGLFGKPPFVVQLASGAQFSLRIDELKKIRCRRV